MMIKPGLLSQLRKIGAIAFAWGIFAIYQYFTIFAIVQSEEYHCDVSKIDFPLYFRGTIIYGILAGIVGGSATVFLWKRWLRKIPYNKALFHIFWSFTVAYLAIYLLTDLQFQTTSLNTQIGDPRIPGLLGKNLFNWGGLQSYISWFIVVLITLATLLVNDKYGPGVLRSFLLGKYFIPTREERLFMFLDMKSSTTIAEQVGEVKYFELLREVYALLSPVITRHKGEIYQYVGDEIVITWKLENTQPGLLVFDCFRAIKRKLEEKSERFTQNFGIVPEFKAGLHGGFVMSGEIGKIKTDLAYSGDVLNTTARIQAKCNDYQVDLLFSDAVYQMYRHLEIMAKSRKIDEMVLRGKNQTVTLYTLTLD